MFRKCTFAVRHGMIWSFVGNMSSTRRDNANQTTNPRRSIAELAETLYEIQTEMEEKRNEQNAQRATERQNRVWERSIEEQRSYFMKSEALRRQILVLGKSECSVRIMMQSIEERAEIERVRGMLDKTIQQQTKQDIGEQRAQGQELLEQIETMSEYIDRSHDAINSIASLGEDLSTENFESDRSKLVLNSDFIAWQQEISAMQPVSNEPIEAQTEKPTMHNSIAHEIVAA